MKKLTNIYLSLFLLLSVSSFAVDTDEVSEKVKSSFENSFTSASDVKWKIDNGVYFVTFKLNGQDVSAVYNQDGELKSSTRQLSLGQLPLKVLVAIKDKYAGYKINDGILEVFSNDETSYYISAENAKFTVKIKSDASGSLSVTDKVKK